MRFTVFSVISLANDFSSFDDHGTYHWVRCCKSHSFLCQGYHRKYGEPHAEREALASCTEQPEGASIYVTLEPCCHYGKQPPCVNAILESGIRRVIIGSSDPNPLVSGKGIRILKEHGIEVTENVLKEECDKLNEAFFYYIQNQKPYVVMKYAMTMDGKIATYTGASRWVTGEAARMHVQKQRLLELLMPFSQFWNSVVSASGSHR